MIYAEWVLIVRGCYIGEAVRRIPDSLAKENTVLMRWKARAPKPCAGSWEKPCHAEVKSGNRNSARSGGRNTASAKKATIVIRNCVRLCRV